MTRGVTIRKASGESEPFDESKLRRSLRRAGARPQDVDRVVETVYGKLAPGMTTKQLYRIAFRALRRAPAGTAARYGLRRGILELGPDGYPFERFVGGLFEAEGWHCEVGVQLHGRYVDHEVDLDARRDGERALGEVKFRGQSAGKVDVKVAMYVRSRAEDLRALPGGYGDFWLITNGRFTRDAQVYGDGVGLRLLSWDHPEGDGLKDRVERAGLQPVTCLSALRKRDHRTLIAAGIVLCRDLHRRARDGEPPAVPGVPPERLRKALEEARCTMGPDATTGGGSAASRR